MTARFQVLFALDPAPMIAKSAAVLVLIFGVIDTAAGDGKGGLALGKVGAVVDLKRCQHSKHLMTIGTANISQ